MHGFGPRVHSVQEWVPRNDAQTVLLTKDDIPGAQVSVSMVSYDGRVEMAVPVL